MKNPKHFSIILKCMYIVLLIEIMVSQVNGVTLNRQQLKVWNPSFITDTTILLNTRQITLILDDTFVDLIQLKELVLLKNQLTLLNSTHLFSSLINLTKLDLGSNLINSVHSLTFANLTKLNSLSFYFNRLDETSMDSNIFESLISLKTLDLSYNKFTYFPSFLFEKLTSLTTLYLHANQLIQLDTNLFITLVNLNNLHLEFNNLTRIE
jgi:Leucine-rich repeat (LRR) protein